MPNYRNELVSFDCEFMNETDKAWLVNIDGKEHWIPKSIGEADEKYDTIEIPTWFAEKEGIA